LRITRKTLLDIPAPAPTDEPARPDVPDHPAYQQILTTFADTGLAAALCCYKRLLKLTM
jgi:hypothetical protein